MSRLRRVCSEPYCDADECVIGVSSRDCGVDDGGVVRETACTSVIIALHTSSSVARLDKSRAKGR